MTEQHNRVSRRRFLAASLGTLASTGLAGFAACSDKTESAATRRTLPEGDMITRTLGRTGIELPIVSAGATTCTDPTFIQAEFEAGLRLFDTDALYHNGRHEKLLGHVFDSMGVREKVIIMTKVHTTEQRAGLNAQQSGQLLLKTFEGSLKRLRTDYVDILLIQDVSDPRPIKDPAIKETMTQLQAEGKARFLGIATHTNMAVAIDAAVEAKAYDVILTSVNFTMADDAHLMSSIENAAGAGLGIIAMKTQAGGRSLANPGLPRHYDEKTMNSAALKWVCHNKNITTSIPGIANYDHLRADLAIAMDPEYNETEKEFLADREIKLGLEFCHQCRRCAGTCPHEVDIPRLMRTHMYAGQYADFEKARRTLNSIPSHHSLNICSDCGDCRATCANSVNIPKKIEELKLIYA